MKHIVTILLFTIVYLKVNAQKQDTISVYFDLGIHTLNSGTMQYLDSMSYYDQLPVNEKYGIIGYADYIGSENSNVTLSEKRANTVKEYLEGLGIHPSKIATVTGKGEVSREIELNGGYPTDRRVDIVIGGFKQDKPDSILVSLMCECGNPKCFHNMFPKQIKRPVSKKKAVYNIASLKKNETIALKDIFFLPGSHKIRENSTEALFDLYITMQDNPGLKINIEGHICCLTNTTHDGYDYDSQEYGLSKNRAKAVYEYLISKGIDKSRLNYEGFGISKPLKWPERSLADENKNRRVEIRIIEK